LTTTARTGATKISTLHAPNAAVFSALADPAPFGQVFVEHGAVIWPGGIDVAPDAVCAQTKAHPSGP